MSRNKLSVRLRGELPPSEDLTRLLGVAPTVDRRRGMPSIGSGGVQTMDVWAVELAKWESVRADEQMMQQAIATLRKMIPGLTTLDRSRCHAELYMSSIRDEEWGGFDLPSDIIAAAGEAKLELIVSILVSWPSDDEEMEM